MGTNSKLNILIVTPFALWMYIICISNIIMQELSGAPYVAGLITYVSAFIIFLCYYWLLLQNIRKMEDSAKYLKSQGVLFYLYRKKLEWNEEIKYTKKV